MLEFMPYAEIVISILLILVILVQNKNVALNLSTMGGGMGENTKRGAEKVLHNTTVILGVLFILNSVGMFILSK